MAWALFIDGKQISKSYPFKAQAVIDAYEKNLVCNGGSDIMMREQGFSDKLIDVEIKEIV